MVHWLESHIASNYDIIRALPLAFGMLLLVLALLMITRNGKQQGLHASQLMIVMIKDQVVYFIASVGWLPVQISTEHTNVVTLSRAVGVATFAIAGTDKTLSFVSSTVLQVLGSPTLLCILGSHMFLNLKEAAEHDVNSDTMCSTYLSSPIQFNLPGGDAIR